MSEVKIEPKGSAVSISKGTGSAPKDVEGGLENHIQGTINSLKVSKGNKVSKGDVVAVLEAMKMENNIEASGAGEVKELFIKEGDSMKKGQLLMAIS